MSQFPLPVHGVETPSPQRAYNRCGSPHTTPECPMADKLHSSEGVSLSWPPTPRGSLIPSLPQQGEQPTQRVRARSILGAMALADSAIRSWGKEHPQRGRGHGCLPGGSAALGGGPLLPLPEVGLKTGSCSRRGVEQGRWRSPLVPLLAPSGRRVWKAPRVRAGRGHEREKWRPRGLSQNCPSVSPSFRLQ